MHYLDEIYHSGYLDGYYASRELYHADDSELTEEEKARRRKRKIALGVGIPVGVAGAAAGLLGGTYLYNEAKYNKELNEDIKAWRAAKRAGKTVTVKRMKSAPKPKRNIPGFRRNPGTYKINPVTGDFGSYLTLHGMHIKARSMKNKH